MSSIKIKKTPLFFKTLAEVMNLKEVFGNIYKERSVHY
jgi:hypothetical protein